MYSLTFDGRVLYDPRLPEYTVRDPDVHLAVGEAGTVNFTLDAEHPNADIITRLKGIVELTEDGVTIYRGRVIKDRRDFVRAHEIETEGLLACLNDSAVAPFSFPEDFISRPDYQRAAATGNVVEYFLGWVLDTHNLQTTAEQHLRLGRVTVRDPNNYIARSSTDYNSAWAVVQDKLAGSALGGYILVRYEPEGTYVDYLDDLPSENAQPVEFAENLLDLTTETDGAQIFSVVLPVGADGLTIASLPDGALPGGLYKSGRTIYDPAKIEQYGRITRVLTLDDVTVATNLRSKAAAELTGSTLAQTITVRAADLHSEGKQSFTVGRYTRLISPPHNFDELFPLMELDIDILDPAGTQITLGKTVATSTDRQKAEAAQSADRADKQQAEINRQTEIVAQIPQDFDGFRDASEYADTQLARVTAAERVSAAEAIRDTDADLQTKHNAVVRAVEGSADGVTIGTALGRVKINVDGDALTVKLGEATLLSIDKGALSAPAATVTEAELASLHIDRSSSGNVTIRKVIR